MKKYIDRGVIVRIPPEELREWKGPVNYVSHHAVHKPESSSTPVRIVMNSSLQYKGLSLNSILAKGPNMLNSMLGVLIRFRMWTYGLVWDISKAYQQLVTGSTEKHVRRILWRDLRVDCNPDVHGLTCVTFGDRPAAAQLEVAKKMVADTYNHVNPKAARMIKEDSYVDGSNDFEQLKIDAEDIKKIFAGGGFQVKGMVMSGDSEAKVVEPWGDTELARVFGIKWEPTTDCFSFSVQINVTKKFKGVRLAENLTQETLLRILTMDLTRRIILGIVNTCHDPLGLLMSNHYPAQTAYARPIQQGVGFGLGHSSTTRLKV